jgi:hypothetical protein
VPQREVVYVKGLNELVRNLKKVDAGLPREFAQTNKKVAGIVATEAARRAPRGEHEGGGRIRPVSETIRGLAQARRVVVAFGGAATPHAGVLEFGGTIPRRGQSAQLRAQQRHAKRGYERAGLAVTRVAKQAYVYPAADATRARVIDLYQQAVADVMRLAFT